ncbi:MAG: helix-turn-helix domain-containing protein [Oscillochloris sp.]|nr:helix-turn-helix domain-containing protein [Oscillochloris sp.]
MSELGARLREARESQGLSLAQVAADTRILQQSLVALEEGAYQRMPSDVVIRGFIRNYATYLGLSPDELIEQYRRERGATDRIQVVPATHPPRTRAYVLPSFFGVFFVTVALVGMAYIVLNAVGRIGERNDTSAAVSDPSPTVPPPSPLPTATIGRAPTVLPAITVAPEASAIARPQSTTDVAGGAFATPTTTQAAPIVLEVFVPAGNPSGSWLRIEADGNRVFEGIMRPGGRETFQAQRRVFIRAGNPPEVQVVVNGLQQGPLGQVSGQPVNWSWPPE